MRAGGCFRHSYPPGTAECSSVLYLRATRARGVAGQVSLWSFVVVILLIYGQGLFGPPPPDERSLAWFALIGWLIPPWGSWIDRTRRSDLA